MLELGGFRGGSRMTPAEGAFYLDVPNLIMVRCFDLSEELRALDENMAALEAVAPKETRKALGLYIYDYYTKRPVPLDLMKHQCELGLRWLKAGRVSDVIFLGNTVLDLDFASAEFARPWIAKMGPEQLPLSGG